MANLLESLLKITDFTLTPTPPPNKTSSPAGVVDLENPSAASAATETMTGDLDADETNTNLLEKSTPPAGSPTTQHTHVPALPGTFLSTLIPAASASFAVQLLFGLPSVISHTEVVYDLAGGVGFYATLVTGFLVPVLRRRKRERERERQRLLAKRQADIDTELETETEAAAGGLEYYGADGNYKDGESGERTNGTGRGRDGNTGLMEGLSLARDRDWRQVVITGSTFLWAFRLSTYLFTRVLRKGHDSRFDRAKHLPRVFAMFWFGQAIWVICVCMPAIAVNSVPLEALKMISTPSRLQSNARSQGQSKSLLGSLTGNRTRTGHEAEAEAEAETGARTGSKAESGSNSGNQSTSATTTTTTTTEKLGVILFLFGFAVENLADYQKSKWWNEKRRKAHNEDFITRGIWGRSQYPNYFGETILQLGTALFASGILLRKPVQTALGWRDSNLKIQGGGGYTSAHLRMTLNKLAATLKALLIPALAPAFTAYTLFKLSGIPIIQRKYDRLYGDREDYRRWRTETPLVVPRVLPAWVKELYPLPV